MTKAVVIKGGTVIDQTGEQRCDLRIAAGRITEVSQSIEIGADEEKLDATGCVVAPGLVDLHVHLRQPGREESETIESGSRAAALGGYTAVVAMPNTEPPCDSASAVRNVWAMSKTALCDVYPAGTITKGRAGKELVSLGSMAEAGVRIFTDDGSGVQDSGLMRRAFEYAGALDVVLGQHCEDESLFGQGVMNEGQWSTKLGLCGVPREAETIMVERDIALARLTGGRIHFLHLSAATSVEAVRRAKEEGLRVSAEAAPHHFVFTDAACCGFDPNFKMNPPLRTDVDVEAVRLGLRDGTIDAIATDHAPHAPYLKDNTFDEAPFGVIGSETALGAALSYLDLPVERVLALMSWQPAEIAGIASTHGRPVAEGEVANLCVFDPDERWTRHTTDSASLSRNDPFDGRELRGKVRHTICHGEVVVSGGRPTR